MLTLHPLAARALARMIAKRPGMVVRLRHEGNT
jgi:hypothetical protein